MLNIFGKRSSFCDGVSRRNFLKIGAFGFGIGQLTLPALLRAEAEAGIRRSQKAVIMVYLPGGPSHQDMYDIKTDAPDNIRGEFKAIDTNVSGIQICEHLPNLARMMDKLVVVRSLVGSEGQHSSFQCLTGRVKKQMPPGGWPALGSILSKVQGAADKAVPPYIGLMGDNNGRGASAGYLGVAHASFSPSGQGRRDMTLNGVTLDRLDDRKALLEGMDRFRKEVDSTGQMNGQDSFNHMALDVLTSSKLADALNVNKEDPKVIEKYRQGPKGDGRGSLDSFCVARRLVEAGARCVTLSYGGWDSHSDNFKSLSKRLPGLDVGVSSLVQDLYERGMDKDVSVVVWGEFGRTPKINEKAGRDHWPRVAGALLAGGGMRTGQAIGRTDRLGGEPADRPVHFGEVFATLYNRLGIDASKTTLPDLSGRPQYLVDTAHLPMPELVA